MVKNPYVIDRPLTEQDLFYGRDAQFESLSRQLVAGQHVLLLSGRRYSGKTSFLHQLALRLGAHYEVRLVNLTATATDPDPLWTLLVALAQGCAQPAPNRAAYESGKSTASFLSACLRALVPEGEDKITLVCMDALAEGEVNQAWVQALARLRQALQAVGNLAMLLAIEGRPLDLSAESSLIAVPQLALGPLREQDTEDLLMIPVRGVLAFEYEVVRRIHHLSGGHPFFVQLFGYILFERRASAGWVGLAEVDHVAVEVIARGELQFKNAWDSASPKAKLVLCAFAEMMGHHGMGAAKDVDAYLRHLRIQMPLADIEEGIAELAAQEVLERLGGETCRFSNELFRRWLKQNKNSLDTLRRIKRYRRSSVKRVSPLRSKRIDWVGIGLWLVAAVLIVLIAWAWRARETGVLGISSPTPLAAPEQPLSRTPTAIPPTPDTGVTTGRIVYMAQEKPEALWQIYAMRSDGTDPVRLTRTETNETSPVWSPDGRRIAFVSDRNRNREIYVMNADGNDHVNLTNDPSEDWTPSWSPDGQRIAFSSLRDGNWEIYAMNANGSNLRRLTQNNAIDFSPAWSPDGQRIAFVSGRDGNLEVYVMATDGSNQTRFAPHPATDQSPAWSPDGLKLFWESYRDGNMEIYVANLDGSDLRNLTRNPLADDHGPSCSPRGNRLAFYSNYDKGWDIYTLDLSTNARVNITQNPLLEQAPHWGR